MADAMIAQGFQPSPNDERAQLAVTYAMSIGDPRSRVSSSPDFVWGGQQVSSSTTYSRFMQIKLYDVQQAENPEDAILIWQAEISSEGSSSNYISVGEDFISILFENFGKTNINDSFYRIVTQ